MLPLLVLRFFHVVSGVLWAGALVFVAGFLMPALRASGPAAGPVMGQLGKVYKMPIYMMVVAILTVLSGIGLIMVDSGGAPGVWMKSGPGHMFGLGGVLAILAAILGMAVSSPAARKMSAIGALVAQRGGPPTTAEAAEMQRLQARVQTSTQAVAVLVLLATTAMAIARYVP
jgi:hypothetical protein